MEKRIRPLLFVNHPNIKQNIKNLEKLDNELKAKKLGYLADNGDLVYDSKDEKEVAALMDKFLLP